VAGVSRRRGGSGGGRLCSSPEGWRFQVGGRQREVEEVITGGTKRKDELEEAGRSWKRRMGEMEVGERRSGRGGGKMKKEE
jgi:hypothetical protein